MVQGTPSSLASTAGDIIHLVSDCLGSGLGFLFQKPEQKTSGQLSAIVEPMAGVMGAAAVIAMRPLLPHALPFAAGATIFVVVEEVIPESQLGKNTGIATMGTIVGFAVMMTLDAALGCYPLF